MIKEIIVEKKKWLTEDEILEVIAIAESTPGPMAINLATYIGYKNKKFIGSILSTLGVILPSLIIIFSISLFFEAFISNKYVAYAFIGVKAAVAFLILKAAIDIIIKMDKKIIPIIMLIITSSLIILFEILNIKFSAIYYILIGGTFNLLLNIILNKKKDNEEKDLDEGGNLE
jgi:chromate transporter